MKVADAMSRGVISVLPQTTIDKAARLMLLADIGGLPVVNNEGELVGIVTETDFLRRAELGTAREKPRWIDVLFAPGKAADQFVRAHGRKVADIMSSPVHSVTEETDLADAVDLMERHKINRLPVIQEGRIVGMVARSDLMQAIVDQHRSEDDSGRTDAQIRDEIIARLKAQPWAPIYGINVVVRDGIVQLSGTIFNDRERHALIVAAETTRGVRAVKDQIVVIDPASGEIVYRPDGARQ
jgi:CBS-domain-containing membrane protein